MSSIYVNVNGSYKQAGDVWIQKDGAWKYADRAINPRVINTTTNGWKEPIPPLITQGLYAHYDASNPASFDPTTAYDQRWHDISGNDRELILENMTNFNHLDKEGGCLEFNSGSTTNEGLRRSTSLDQTNNWRASTFWHKDFTLGFWISHQISSVTQNTTNRQMILSVGTNANNANAHVVQQNGGYRFDFYGNNNLSSYYRAINQHWQYVVFTSEYATGKKKFYINGQFDSSQTGAQLNITDDSLFTFFGTNTTSITTFIGFKGDCGAIHAYDRLLTGKEIKQNYEATKKRFHHGLNTEDNAGIIKSGLEHSLGYSLSEDERPTAISFDNYQLLKSDNDFVDSVKQDYNDNNYMVSKVTPWYANLVNGPTVNDANNGYVDFDGSNDYASVPSFTMPNVPFTVECFFNYDSVSAYEGICGMNSTTGGTNPFMQLERDGGSTAGQTGTMQFSVGNTSGQKNELHTTTVLATGTWYHLVATATSSEMKIYLNNTLEGTLDVSGQTLTTPASGGNDLVIGASIYNNAITAHADVKIGKFRIYSKALSQLEVTHNWNTQKALYGL